MFSMERDVEGLPMKLECVQEVLDVWSSTTLARSQNTTRQELVSQSKEQSAKMSNQEYHVDQARLVSQVSLSSVLPPNLTVDVTMPMMVEILSKVTE